MPKDPGLERRKIRKQLISTRGWHVISRVDGFVDVQIPTARRGDPAFVAEVREALKQLGYSAQVNPFGAEWVRVRTKETVEQAGRGAHSG